MKRTLIFLLSLFAATPCIGQPCTKASFYLVAHQDQWQLFMGLNAFNDIAGGMTNKVIFIYTTAGDSSCGGTPLRIPFYHARQQGADNSLEFCADQWGKHDTARNSYVLVNGHSILKHTYKNVVSYNLVLPDGCYSVGLFGQSLQFLNNHPTTPINTVDNSTTYTGWNDLMLTIQDIIINESTGIPTIMLNTADTDRIINPADHPDHIYTAMLGLEAVSAMPGIQEVVYQGYNIARLPPNLSDADMATKTALLSILDYGRTSNAQLSEWAPSQIIFTGRNYFRQIR